MTTNYHTPIAVGAPADAATINEPLGKLDEAIGTINTGSGGGGGGGSYYSAWAESPAVKVLVSTVSPYSASAYTNFTDNTALINGNSFPLLVTVNKSFRYQLSQRFGSAGVFITQPLDTEKFTFYGRLGLNASREDINGQQQLFGYFGHTVEAVFTTDNVIEYWTAGTVHINGVWELPAGQSLTLQPVYTWIESRLAKRRLSTQSNPVTSNDNSDSGKNIYMTLTAGQGSIVYTRKLP